MSNLPTWHEYVMFTDETANYPCADIRCGEVPDYVFHGLREEYGEVHGCFKRMLRDDDGRWTHSRLANLRAEIGDVLWYCARYVQHYDELAEYEDSDVLQRRIGKSDFKLTRDWWYGMEHAVIDGDVDSLLLYLWDLCAEFGWRLDEIAAENMAKLRSRKARGVIQGSGGDR